MTALLSLPLRTPIHAGESLDSWIDALARRSQISPREVLRAFGIDYPALTVAQLLDHTSAARLRHIEAATGLPPHRLDAAVGAALAGAKQLRTRGTRYCPACLDEGGGRWQLIWRTKWAVACLHHQALLHEKCPSCDTIPRRGLISASRERPATGCEHILDKKTQKRCRTDLATAAPVNAAEVAIEAQTWIEELLAQTHDPTATQAQGILTDLHAVCAWLLSNDESALITAAKQIYPGCNDRTARDSSGGDPALTAATLVRAKTILGPDENAALAAIGHIVDISGSGRRVPPPRMNNPVWYSATTPRFQNRYLRAVDTDLPPTERLRLRTTLPNAALPGDRAPARAAMIPQLIWPDWAGRLLPSEGHWADLHRGAMSAALLIPGHPQRNQAEDVHSFNARVARATISVPLRGHDQVVRALGRLAHYLDEHGSPIDYQRRRDRIPAETIDHNTWWELACSVDAHPGDEATQQRLRNANRYLNQLLTGADLADPRHALAFAGSDDRSHHLRFTLSMSLPLRQALREYAASVLARLDIDEPLTWSPPASLAEGLALPGIDIAELDIDKIEQLVIVEHRRLVDVADILGVHIEHIRFALERLDRPQRTWPKSAPPAAWRREQQAEALLTREFFEHEHLEAGRSLKELSAATGFTIAELSQQARRCGVTVRKGQAPTRIDPTWLREQYLDRRRNMADIAAELGTVQGVIANALQRFDIPARAGTGVVSWTETNRTYHDLPAGVRKAVEGTYNGWERLRRFQVAMQFPMLKPAARYLGIDQGNLAAQLDLLERHLGAALFTRYSRPEPQKPTALGQALLAELATESVHAQMIAALGETQCPAMPRPQALSAIRPFDDLAVQPLSYYRGLENLLRVIANHGLDNEFCCIEIAAQTKFGVSTTNRFLMRMAAANWVTRRPETETEREVRVRTNSRARQRIYYRFTPDGHQAALRSLRLAESDKPMRKQRRQTHGKNHDSPRN
ncbi:TniQ family protein [Nocardia brasiliensis]|uniref:TniQ family protein n=1 Tax=Nocardia brasiliensis TaxID=37326 RepID=UPI002459092D|nr:TniQ family protein [Nocardia brasiliensis]